MCVRCMTADVWKACLRGYFGMMVRWIDPATLQSCKAAISCTRLIGRNMYDALASKIESVHHQFELCGKVTAIITDNRSNFVKAFKTFSVDSKQHRQYRTHGQCITHIYKGSFFIFLILVTVVFWWYHILQTMTMTILKLSMNCHLMKGVQHTYSIGGQF